MSSASPGSSSAAGKNAPAKKKLFPWDRIVLLVVLVIGLVLVVLDYRARWAFEAALTDVSKYLPENEELADRNPIDLEKNPTREQVRQMVGKEPTAGSLQTPTGVMDHDTFAWSGIFRSFGFRVGYRRVGDQLRLDRVETISGDELKAPAPVPPADNPPKSADEA